MKRRIAAALLAVLVLTAAGCEEKGAPEEPVAYSTEIDGQSVVITFDEGTRSSGTISAENGEYTFAYDMSGGLTVYYPNGSSCTQRDGAVAYSPDLDAEADGYISPVSLILGH